MINYSKYQGEWVAMFNNKVIAHDKDLLKLDNAIENCKGTPTIFKVPVKGMIYTF